VFAVRIMGKRQISELQTSELVVTLVIADIASIPMENNSQSLASGIVPTLILVGCEILASVGMMKWSKFRRLMCGNPVMVIQDGEILQDKMESLRLTTEDLCIQLRQQGVFSLDDVQYCIAETNGKLSVLEKPKSRKPTAQDVGVEIEDNGIEVVVINDGEILNNSLKLCQAENKTIYKILENNKLTVKDVFIMTMDRNGSYKIIKKDRKKK
jgi:uncharacterized membrane protein YcaP (DUF421 family)